MLITLSEFKEWNSKLGFDSIQHADACYKQKRNTPDSALNFYYQCTYLTL